MALIIGIPFKLCLPLLVLIVNCCSNLPKTNTTSIRSKIHLTQQHNSTPKRYLNIDKDTITSIMKKRRKKRYIKKTYTNYDCI